MDYFLNSHPFDGKMNITKIHQVLGEILLTRFVYPFEIVSFVLLAALIGGIILARKDNALIDDRSSMILNSHF